MDELANWVARLVAGREAAAAIDALGQGGIAAVRALVDGYRMSIPPGRHLRDVHDDLAGVLWLLAERDPGALLVVMAERVGDDVATANLAYALGASRDPIAVEALLDLLDHIDAHVRWCAVASLERIGTAEAIAPLPAMLADRADSVRFAALQAIATQLPPGSKEAVRGYLDRGDLPEGGLRLATRALARVEAHGGDAGEREARAPAQKRRTAAARTRAKGKTKR